MKKRALSIMSAAMLAVTVSMPMSVSALVQEEIASSETVSNGYENIYTKETKNHDFNEDRKVSISDAQAILEYYSTLQTQPTEAANEKIASDKTLTNVSKNGDINSDGSINALDAHLLLNSLYPDGLPYGDFNNDTFINASDASLILSFYSKSQTSNDFSLTDEQSILADVNLDGAVNASDASTVLAYYAYSSAGGTDSFADFLDVK